MGNAVPPKSCYAGHSLGVVRGSVTHPWLCPAVPSLLPALSSPSRLRQEGGREKRGRHLPFPMEGASPFMNLGKDLLGDEGTSREATGLLPSRSILPACWRNCSRSRDSRLNCSLCVRHFSSSSRTLHYTQRPRHVVSRWPGLLGPHVSAPKCVSVCCTCVHKTECCVCMCI